jgi:hypothetical protein
MNITLHSSSITGRGNERINKPSFAHPLVTKKADLNFNFFVFADIVHQENYLKHKNKLFNT